MTENTESSKNEPSKKEADAPAASDLVKCWPRTVLCAPSRCLHGAYYRSGTKWCCYWCDKDFDELPRWQFLWPKERK